MKDAIFYDPKEDQEFEDPNVIIALLEQQLKEEKESK